MCYCLGWYLVTSISFNEGNVLGLGQLRIEVYSKNVQKKIKVYCLLDYIIVWYYFVESNTRKNKKIYLIA